MVMTVAAVVVVWQPVARFLLSCDPRDMHLVAPSLLWAGDLMVPAGEAEDVMLGMAAEARSPFQWDLLSTSPYRDQNLIHRMVEMAQSDVRYCITDGIILEDEAEGAGGSCLPGPCKMRSEAGTITIDAPSFLRKLCSSHRHRSSDKCFAVQQPSEHVPTVSSQPPPCLIPPYTERAPLRL